MSENDNSFKEHGDRDARQEMSGSPLSQYMVEHASPNSKYSARYARQSLEYTNVRTADAVDHASDRPPSRASVSPDFGMGRNPSPAEDAPVYGDNKENGKRDQQFNSYQEVRAAGMPSDGTAGSHIVIPRRENVGQRNERDEHLGRPAAGLSLENCDARRAENAVYGEYKENVKRDQQFNSYQEVRAAGMPSDGTAESHVVIPWKENHGQRNERDEHSGRPAAGLSLENCDARRAENASAYGDYKEDAKRDYQYNIYQEVRAAGMPSDGTAGSHIVIPRRENLGQRNERDEYLENSSEGWSRKNSDARQAEKEEKISARQEQDKLDKHDAMETQNVKDTKKKDQRQFEVEKTMPWLRADPGIKNLSKQMFMYLTHNELKTKIDDLAKREQHACNKHCWDEALRLRDMRNRVELVCEKQLYNIEDFEIDENVKKVGLHNIGKREAELAERESVCTDTTMYSQDAKDMWEKWVHEDDKSAIKDARHQRETLMNSLEKEWQDLAIREKEKLTKTYQNVMQDSDVQEEHKLAAAIHAAAMKSSFPSSLK